MALTKAGDGRVIGGVVGGDEPARDVLFAAALDLARASLAAAVAVEEQGDHDLGVERRPAPPVLSTPGIERSQVHLVYDVDDEPGEVILFQPVVDRRRQQVVLIAITGDEVVGHARDLREG